MNKIKIIEFFAQKINFIESSFKKKNAFFHRTNMHFISSMLHSLPLTGTREEEAKANNPSICSPLQLVKRFFSLCSGPNEHFINIIK